MGLAERHVTSDVSFIQRYNELTDIIVETARDVFGVTRKIEIEEKKISSPKIRQLERKLKRTGGALNLERRGPLALVSDGSQIELRLLRQEYEQEKDNHHGQTTALRDFILKKRRTLYKDLYHAQMDEVIYSS